MAERDLAGIAGQQIQAERHQHVDEQAGHDVEDVVVGDAAAARARPRTTTSSTAPGAAAALPGQRPSHLPDRRGAEQAARPDDEDEDEQDVRRHLLDPGVEEVAREVLENAQQHAADDGAGDAAEAAQDGPGERLDADEARGWDRDR